MKKILVLFRFDPGHPTGITRLVRNLCTQLADRDCEVLLAMPAVEKTFIHYKQVWEEFADSAGKVSVQWWDGAEFTPPQRERLVYNMERLHDEQPLDHVISIGITDCGFATAIASRMFSIPFSVFATYQDTLCYHSLQPQEVDLCVSSAFRVATTNPHVLQHIHAFHPVEETSMLIDPRPDRSEISRQGNTPKPQSRSTTSYVVTTGSLDQFVYLPDLVARILEIAAGEDLSIWQHVGSCCPVARSHIEVLLATEEGPTFLNDFEVVARSQYVELVSDAVIHVIPQRKSDTNSAAYESEIWGVPTDYPSSHCFPSLGQQGNSIRFGTTTVKLSGIESLAEDIAR